MRHLSSPTGPRGLYRSEPFQIEKVREKVLEAITFNARIQVPSHEVNVSYAYIGEYMADMLTARLQLPGEVLQNNEVVAEYPASLWDHVKKKLGLKHELVRVRCHETVVFPSIALPPHQHCVCVRWREGTEASV